MIHISLAAETLWNLFGFLPITNSLLTTWFVMALLFLGSWLVTRNLSLVPGNAQLVAEFIVGGLYEFFEAIAGKYLKQFFPLVISLFLFILAANWVGLLPGVGTIGFFHQEAYDASIVVTQEESVTPDHEEKEPAFTPLLRAATADLNTTIALALVAVIAMQYFGFKNLGAHYFKRFIDLKDPISFSVGILEIVSDISKILSFAFRLFGNIFAGEVLLAVMAFLIPFIVPLPFLFMEIFVGVIQAVVFSMLTCAFLALAISHGADDHSKEGHVSHSDA